MKLFVKIIKLCSIENNLKKPNEVMQKICYQKYITKNKEKKIKIIRKNFGQVKS